MQTEKYSRKPFFIDAVQVTAENMAEVAKWCGGEVVEEKYGARTTSHIRVDVPSAKTERQKKALIGDWVLKHRKSFKCYTPKAFDECFEKPSKDVVTHYSGQSPLPLEELAEKYAPGRV